MNTKRSKPLPILSESPTFCALPWVHLCASVDGVWGRCCVDSSMYYDHYYKMEARPVFTLLPDAIGCLPLSSYATANPERTFDLNEAFNSPAMRETRLSMLAGKKVAACQYCYERENSEGTSYRQLANGMFGDHANLAALIDKTAADGFLDEFPCYLDLRFGNTCNLECVMCGFPVSSRWVQNRMSNG